MQIAIIAPGSRGDVQPYVALGRGLIEAGHGVRVLSNQNHENLVKSNGIEFWWIEVNSEDIVRSEKMRAAMESGSSIRSLSQMRDEMKLHAVLIGKRGLECCQGVDLVIGGISGVFTSHTIAEKLEIPFMQAYNIPITPTKEFPGALFPKFPRIGGYRLSHFLTRQMLWQAYSPTDHIVRQDYGLPEMPRTGPYKSESFCKFPTIYGLSPSVIPKPADWGNDVHVTGYWFLDAEDDLNPSHELVDFVEEGPPPVYIGFGSMGNRTPEQLSDLVLEALKETDQRAVLHTGWGGLSELHVPETVLIVNSAPHAWLFPRVGAVIHHGGAGTTGAGLRSGVPSIIVPFHGDQPFWGWLVAKLGVGSKPIPHTKLTSQRLAKAIHQAVTNNEMKKQAAELGARIQAEDGINSAVDIINQINM